MALRKRTRKERKTDVLWLLWVFISLFVTGWLDLDVVARVIVLTIGTVIVLWSAGRFLHE
jgi:hypothetical protein